MSVALYMDEHVQAAITHALRDRGVDVLTVQEDGWDRAADPVVLDRAGELGRVVFTRDADFLREATRRQGTGEQFVGVIYAHQLHVGIGQCISDLEMIAAATDLIDHTNHVQFLPALS
ncbi:MAG: hypothetical protein JWL69_5216 [Phycisphaerales bacterium]|nr:hypothetical protein [Phycisphaerales bacterium]